MKRFLWKIVICLTPVLVSAVVVAVAYNQYVKGAGGFKLGVDLAGGTDLIYQVDPAKYSSGKLSSDDSQKMVASLKKRIDPADLYNVTIRPVSDTRFEIILPTGGKHQADAEEAFWNDLLA